MKSYFSQEFFLTSSKVDQFLVQRLIKQFDIAVFPEPNLSNADVVHHLDDCCCFLTPIPRVVLESSVLYVTRAIAYLTSTLLMILPVTAISRLILEL